MDKTDSKKLKNKSFLNVTVFFRKTYVNTVAVNFFNHLPLHFDFEKLNVMALFDEPTSRLYHVNIAASLFLIVCVAWLQTSRKSNLQISPAARFLLFSQTLGRWIFRKKYWWNRSTRQDYFIYIFNIILKVVLLVPLLDISFAIARPLARFFYTYVSESAPLAINADFSSKQQFVAVAIFTLFTFIWDDFLRFFHHWLMHKIPFLWNFHRTHHSARILTPLTLFRTHPIESGLAVIRNSISLGVASGCFVFLFGGALSLWTVLGVNAFGFAFNFFGANLRHSHIPLSFGPFEKIVISPLQHQIHHSKDINHYDKNFGVSLAIWDYMWGSLVYSSPNLKLKFGLKEKFPTLKNLLYK